MIQPKPFKFKCSKCGYCRIVYPKSDVLNINEILSFCRKCKIVMYRKELNSIEIFLI
jgi:DNA-directed RNA polymerase subunit M/transcription elongation factor TFIIS